MTKLEKKNKPKVSDWTAADLKNWREGHSFSQVEAAAAIGIGRQQWLPMENGRRDVDLVVKLACAGYDALKGA
jgi:DNA-binding XRE family transcriptional regulator